MRFYFNHKIILIIMYKFSFIKLKIITFISIIFLASNAFSQENKDNLNQQGEFILVPNTDIKIALPENFEPLNQENVFIHKGSSSTVQVLEIQGTSYSVFTKDLTKEYFKTQGLELISQENVKTKDNKDGTMFIVSFMAKANSPSTIIVDDSLTSVQKDVAFERIMFFTGNQNKTVWINANYPVVAKDLLFDVLKKSILSVKF